MSIVPPGRADAIQFFIDHLAVWTADPAAIGLSPAQVAQLAADTAAASGALSAAQLARIDSKAKTLDFYQKTGDMRTTGTALIAAIKAFAETSADPSVYVAAQIPEPATPTPTPAPGTPYDFRITLRQSGVLELGFKSDNPGTIGGVQYEVQRQDETQGAFGYILTTGEKRFEDVTIPQGTSRVTYRITARRSTVAGAAAQFTVTFGAANGQVLVSPSLAA